MEERNGGKGCLGFQACASCGAVLQFGLLCPGGSTHRLITPPGKYHPEHYQDVDKRGMGLYPPSPFVDMIFELFELFEIVFDR